MQGGAGRGCLQAAPSQAAPPWMVAQHLVLAPHPTNCFLEPIKLHSENLFCTTKEGKCANHVDLWAEGLILAIYKTDDTSAKTLDIYPEVILPPEKWSRNQMDPQTTSTTEADPRQAMKREEKQDTHLKAFESKARMPRKAGDRNTYTTCDGALK